MKCLDTPLLEDLLEGKDRARRWLATLEEGGEVATTEVNVFELGMRARARGKTGLSSRLRALERLRKELTVLPLDAEASRRSLESYARRASGGGVQRRSRVGRAAHTQADERILAHLIAGAALAHGATEILTDKHRWFPSLSKSVKLRRY